MQNIVSFVIGMALALIISYLFFVKVKASLCTGVNAENKRLESDLQNARLQLERRESEFSKLQNEHAALQSNMCALTERMASYKNQMAKDEENFKQREEDLKNGFKEQLELMKAQFEALSQKILKERTEELKGANKENVENITKPFLTELEGLRKMLGETKTGNDKNISALEATIKTVLEQSKAMNKTTENLAEALRNRGKVQGDWGEQILENILHDSGLREGKEYSLQKNYKGEAGNDLRPDVVVHCADGSNIIVDSKVSLTAYCDYIAAENDVERAAASARNLESIWSHVKELSEKNYRRFVENAVPLVLMFVPNEGSYILAMNQDPQIGQKAFNKGVIIINPTNLMLALSLIVRTWNNTRQEENCIAILKAAESIYEKFCTFSEKMVKLGANISTLQKTYEDSVKTLKDGKGNLSGQIDGLLKLGVASSKRIDERMASVLAADVQQTESTKTIE